MSSDLERLTFRQLRLITDNFSEERKIGEGTFGKVYKGVHTNGEEIAVKVFHSMVHAYDHFENDFNRLVRLKHQNIVRLVAFCDETEIVHVEYDGKFILAEKMNKAVCFSYAHNGSLQKHISDKSHGLDWPTRYRIIKGTCQGLKHLHHGSDRIILHLGIKPDNILLDYNMEPKLDFTMSLLGQHEDMMKTISSFGTLGYMPPEFITRGIISNKLDIFSLGVVIKRTIFAGQMAGFISIDDMEDDEFIDMICANWRRRLQSTFRGATLDAYCEQVKRCSEIAVLCMDFDRY